MNKMKNALVWLSRIHHSRGFGIQSPTDYRFVRYVINEHAPYYLYDDLYQQVTDIDDHTRKLCKLYFRLANFVQPAAYIDFMPANHAYQRYVKAACKATQVSVIDDYRLPHRISATAPILARCDASTADELVLRNLAAQAPEHSILVMQDIKQGRVERQRWMTASLLPQVGSAYDLYHCGIIIIDNRRYKKKYIINF